ncbi:MAG: hypothetical protein ABSD98_09610 [Candidatus Korobacteraceae bacterium]|jgi:hypothetical protein
MEFASDTETRRLSAEAREFFEKILWDEQPVFVSDEATVFDISTTGPEVLSERCLRYYGTTLSAQDLAQPFWRVLRQLNEGRRFAENQAPQAR